MNDMLIGHNSQFADLSDPQFDLVTTDAPFPAFVGGFGSGKTEALIIKALMMKAKYPTGNIGYYLPTFDLVSMIAFPRFEEKLEEIGAHYKAVRSPRPVIKIENGGNFIFRTMDNPGRIIGYEVMDSLIDEIDTLKEKEAEAAWNKILARNRQKKPDGKRNTISVGTTPEGFKFTYQKWKKNPKAGYQLIKASTYSNAHNLPDDYIDDLKASYPSNLILAYIDGEFTNLTSGSVYPEFDREKNGSTEVVRIEKIAGLPDKGEDLYIGMDFNVTKMAAIVFVRRAGWPHAVAELTGIFDTPAMIKALKARFPNNRIFIYPDASGGSRKTGDASISDISLLKEAGFQVYNNPSNPAIKDRVLSINVLILNSVGQRRFFVNVKECPNLTEALEKQAYDKFGEPDKTSGLDHPLDAAGYFISYTFPVRARTMKRVNLAGV